jgi:hypothetical protein
VAKARRSRPAKRGSAPKSKRSKPSKKLSAKTTKTAKKPAKKPVKAVKTVELKKLREQFAGVLAVLAERRVTSPDSMAKLDDTRRRISQWMTDVDDICTPELQEICGPDMAFPLP